MPWVTCGQEKEFRLKGFISLEEINLSRQKQNYRFYLFDKSWCFPIKRVIYAFTECIEDPTEKEKLFTVGNRSV